MIIFGFFFKCSLSPSYSKIRDYGYLYTLRILNIHIVCVNIQTSYALAFRHVKYVAT